MGMGHLVMNKIIIFFLILGCSQNDKQKVIKSIDIDGNLICEIPYNNKSKKDGLAKFYKKGILTKEISYKNGKKDGLAKYYNDGILIKEISYKNDKINGKFYGYYKSGIKQFEEARVNDIIFGEAKDYYLNGKLRMYRCFDFEGNLRFVSKYNERSERVSLKGEVLGQLESNYNLDNIPINQKNNFKVCVSTPPDLNTKVYILELKGSKVMKKLELPIKSNIANYYTTYNTRGRVQLIFIGQLIENNNIIVLQDTISVKINVN